MKKNDVLPLRIDPCPIIEANVEVRFSSKLPAEAIFGVVYTKVADLFEEVEKLPILQLPEIVRDKDQNFRYQAHYLLKKDNLHLKIGPRVLTFSNIKEYAGWHKLWPTIKSVFRKLEDSEVIKFPERIGIRYINLFRFAILKHINVRINLCGEELAEQTTAIRTEISENEFLKIIQIVNNGGVKSPVYTGQGSLLDIDCIYNFQQSDTDFYSNYEEIIEKAHLIEKKTFFSMLKPGFLKQLNPVYEEVE